jgi:hypothetical protein
MRTQVTPGTGRITPRVSDGLLRLMLVLLPAGLIAWIGIFQAIRWCLL